MTERSRRLTQEVNTPTQPANLKDFYRTPKMRWTTIGYRIFMGSPENEDLNKSKTERN